MTVGKREARLQRHFDTNFHGARRLMEALIPSMEKRGYGRVVNVASSAGMRGYAYVSAYCASKFALVGYSLALADELEGTGVHVNLVCPHYVDSPLLAESVQRLVKKTRMDEKLAREFFRRSNPGERLITVDEVAAAVARLLREDEQGGLGGVAGSPELRSAHPSGSPGVHWSSSRPSGGKAGTRPAPTPRACSCRRAPAGSRRRPDRLGRGPGAGGEGRLRR